MPCEAIPVNDALKGWASHLKIERMRLNDDTAQVFLRNSKVSAFPVLVVSGDLSKREWGSRCIRELHLVSHGGRFLVALEWPGAPFSTYAQIQADPKGKIRVKPNHYAGALLLHQMGQLEFAAKSYRLALAENTNDYRSWNNLGAILYENQNLKKTGSAMFRHAVKLNAAYEPALKNLVRYYTDQKDIKKILSLKERLGWLAIQNKRWEEAFILFKECIADQDLEFSARRGLAYIAVQQGRLDSALVHLQKCLQLNPQSDGDFANLLAGVYFRLNDQEKATEWYFRALKSPSLSTQAYPNLCFLLSSTGQWDKLLTVATEGGNFYAKDTSFGFYKTQALTNLNRTAEAISTLQTLSAVSKDAAFRASYELALIYGRHGERSAFVHNAQKFLQSVLLQKRSIHQQECMEITNLALKLEDHCLAAGALVQVLRAKPSDVVAHKLLALCYQNMGQPQKRNEHLVLAKQFGGEIE